MLLAVDAVALVGWVLPGSGWAVPMAWRYAAVVAAVAARFGDEVLDVGRFQTRDRLHPADYRAVARALLR